MISPDVLGRLAVVNDDDRQLVLDRVRSRVAVAAVRNEDLRSARRVFDLDAEVGSEPVELAPDLPADPRSGDDGGVARERVGHRLERSDRSRTGALAARKERETRGVAQVPEVGGAGLEPVTAAMSWRAIGRLDLGTAPKSGV